MEDLAWIGFDLSAACDKVHVWSERLVRMVEGLDPERTNAPAANVGWSISEVLAHMAAALDLYLAQLGGERSSWYDLSDMARSGARSLELVDERAPALLAPRLQEGCRAAVRRADGADALERIPWHGGRELPLGAILGLLLGELLVHGQDIASALHADWRPDTSDAMPVARAGFAFAPYVVNRDVARARPTSYDVRLKGLPATTWRFDAAGLTLTPSSGDDRVDTHLATDALTFMRVSYGRTTALRTALRGRAIAWGRRPLGALRLAGYLTPG